MNTKECLQKNDEEKSLAAAKQWRRWLRDVFSNQWHRGYVKLVGANGMRGGRWKGPADTADDENMFQERGILSACLYLHIHMYTQ